MVRALAVVAAMALVGGLLRGPRTAQAFNPIMHNSSSTSSAYWGGGWGNSYNSKYGKITCTTCHSAGPSSGNVKQIRANVATPANSRNDRFPSEQFGVRVVFKSSTSYGSDNLARTSSNRICEVCHTTTKHHRYDNSQNATTHKGDIDCVACHLHRVGFKKQTAEGGGRCSNCHSDLYGSSGAAYGMHSNIPRMSYKHYLDNDDQTYTTGAAGIPDGTTQNLTARRCTMCHVDHDVFGVQSSASAGRAYNLRDRADGTVVNKGYNDDYNLCLSCHYQEKTKFMETPNSATKVMPIPMAGLSYNNATSVLTFSTHGYAVTSRFNDAKVGSSTFRGICVKCHNDTIGGNGDLGPKSSEKGQDSTYKFGEHNSTIPSRFAVYGNPFYQRPADITKTSLDYSAANKTITIGGSQTPNWDADMHQGHTITVTGGTGSNQRMRIIGNTANVLTLAGTFATPLDNTSIFDISDDNMSVDSVCFSCHSKAGQEKAAANVKLDWYGQKAMKSPLEGIRDLFVGDSGTLASPLRSATTITVTTTKNWDLSDSAHTLVGYQFKTPGGTRTISAQATASTGTGPYTTTFSVPTRLSSGTGEWQIIKPSSHTLDTYSRHDSYERVNPQVGWNKGDSGVSTSSSGTGNISDSSKTWNGAMFNGMTIWFPGNFDSSGNPAKSVINGGTAGQVTFTPIPGFTPNTTSGGDAYFIGTALGAGRHVACADCHNTHATFNNPEGDVTSAGQNTLIASDSVNRSGWKNNQWVGYLMKVTSSTGYEQVRYITAFDKTLGQYTVSIPWTTQPGVGYTYEVLMGDKWTVAGQSGGRAGSGSSGSWGMYINGWRTPTLGNMTGATSYRLIENVFDNVSTTGLRGSPTAGQRDLCMKCHSSYAYGTSTPMTPSGTASTSGTVAGRSTDIAKEFNPNNLAHHAVYARGKNQPLTAGGTSWKKSGTATGGTTTTLVDSTATFDASYVGRTVLITSGANRGQSRVISAQTSTTSLTVGTSWNAPVAGDTYAILNSGTATGGSTTTITGSFDSSMLGKTVVILSGTGQGQSRLITAATSTTLTVATWTAPASGSTYAVLNSFNPNWPIFNGAGTLTASISTAGAVTLSGGGLPATALPGWMIYTLNDNTWREITTINSATSLTVTPAPTWAISGSPFIITAGLGNAFVPPYGPWSILRCTDCHGSTKKDPVGPHASVNKWLLKDGDDKVSFPWYNASGSIVTITPNTGMTSTAYFCYNCHRRDVYCDINLQNPTSTSLNLGRQPHGKTGLDTGGQTLSATATKWPQFCRACHAGDKLGGIHGTNAKNGANASGTLTNLQGKRFLNGSSWGTFATGGGLYRSTTQALGQCYTASVQNATVDNCSKSHSGGSTTYGSKANYDYDNP